ncbi:hypothetical protein HPS57_11085 [Prevotella sp. PINT]|uniref:hypothetical protein n=1 Tax=Palleniella intestinalis TaxID=2736291 RepID=UPI001555FB99|nr:hypothetical protein [Palleniella intestinalis]NPD82509.1 hypothetical protein [Palleniella intestinalis]
MEIFNFTRCMGLVPATCTFICLTFCSCSSIDESFGDTQDESTGKIIHLDNGETIILSDTTTYYLDNEETEDSIATSVANAKSNLFDLQSRASNVYKAYGYDRLEPESDWRKYSVGNRWVDYGIVPGSYIARYFIVHKNLTTEPGTSVSPGNYESANAPKNAMGLNGTTGKIGFIPIPTTDYITDGVSRIFVINCDASGIVYNKNLPADPSNFIWAYQLIENSDVWQ